MRKFYINIISRNVIMPVLFILIIFIPGCAQTKDNKTVSKIKEGSKIPAFSLRDQDGRMFDIGTVLGRKNLVIYFYPLDDSYGCTREACYFRDQYEVFSQQDAVIIGISSQSVESHKKFAEKHRLTFTLLSDENSSVRRLFGVPSAYFGIMPGRVTYIVDKTGTVVYVFISQAQATKHVDEALRVLRNLK